MPYYRGTRVPECFERWDGGDPECQVCQVEAMCCQAQEDKHNRGRGKSSSSSSSSQKITSSGVVPTSYKEEDILPSEGESAMSRLGKNILTGCAKETGVQIALFFSRYRIK